MSRNPKGKAPMYPPETRDIILERIAQGESLRSICTDQSMPERIAVHRWLQKDEEFATKYARAREEQAEVLFDDMAEIEEKTLSGELKPDAARVVLASRQWRAAKLKPKKYGDKLDLNHSGAVRFERIETVVVDPKG